LGLIIWIKVFGDEICKSSNNGTKQQDAVSFGEFVNHPIMALSDKMVQALGNL